MDKIYVIYSKTRNVIYLNDEPNTAFWSIYIRNKYPNDKWVVTDTDTITYLEIIRDPSRATRTTLQFHTDSPDVGERKLYKEIREAKEQLAIDAIKARQDGYTDQFLVVKSTRGEAVVVYLGSNVDDALNKYRTTPGAEHVEVWRNGIYVDSINSKSEYLDKVNKKKTS